MKLQTGFYSLLLFCARALDRREFKYLHLGMRSLELYILGPLVFHFLLLRQRNLARFEFRHSILIAEDFNFLWSDLDSNLIILDRHFSVAKFVRSFARLKLLFKFLGEIEIYEENEKNRLTRLYEANEGIYKFIRLFRKLSWTNAELKSEEHLYHKEKAARSNSLIQTKILRQLDCESEQFDESVLLKRWIASKFKLEIDEIRLKIADQIIPSEFYKSSYWEMSFGSNFELYEIVVLFAIVPDGLDFHPELRTAVEMARRHNSTIRRIWQQNVEIEWLHLTAWNRAQAKSPPWFEGWNQRLKEWLSPPL